MRYEDITAVVEETTKRRSTPAVRRSAVLAILSAYSDPLGSIGRLFLGGEDIREMQRARARQEAMLELLCAIKAEISEAKQARGRPRDLGRRNHPTIRRQPTSPHHVSPHRRRRVPIPIHQHPWLHHIHKPDSGRRRHRLHTRHRHQPHIHAHRPKTGRHQRRHPTPHRTDCGGASQPAGIEQPGIRPPMDHIAGRQHRAEAVQASHQWQTIARNCPCADP